MTNHGSGHVATSSLSPPLLRSPPNLSHPPRYKPLYYNPDIIYSSRMLFMLFTFKRATIQSETKWLYPSPVAALRVACLSSTSDFLAGALHFSQAALFYSLTTRHSLTRHLLLVCIRPVFLPSGSRDVRQTLVRTA